MNVDVLVAEIGSTTTIVNAFDKISTANPKFIGQGQFQTTVKDGDVNIGLNGAIKNLKANLSLKDFSWNEMFATSSAAGGLRMSVHGLCFEMTVRAAREAALGAGAIIKMLTCGKLKRSDIVKIQEISPNIILVAGGVDYGERDTAIHNFELIAKNCSGIPVIYAGNIQNHDEINLIAKEFGTEVTIVENVYPQVDILNVEPTRKIIHDTFEKHIVHAKGMSHIRKIVNGPIIPTPGSVMVAAKLLYDEIGDLICFDVGGATTDVHSVTVGSPEINNILLSPEPLAKRTVEGDLGVYVNISHIVENIGLDNIKKVFPDAESLIKNIKHIPVTTEEIKFIEFFTKEAVQIALERHAGRLRDIYGPTGKKTIATGKDLTNVKYIIGTGGALSRLPERINILKSTLNTNKSTLLYPRIGSTILIDNMYIMASLGVLSLRYKESALILLKESLQLKDLI